MLMKKTVFVSNHAPYSLHDMNVTAFEVNGNTITIKTQSGLVRTAPCWDQTDGYVEFHDVEWKWCHARVYEGFSGSTGPFTGRKMPLKDFISGFQNAGFSVMDTYYGENRAAFTGFLFKDDTMSECMIEIYCHTIVFCEQTDSDQLMKEVILSADGDLWLYSVPADAADNLAAICNEFASDYVWHGSKSGRFLRLCGEQYVAFFNADDFIEYLNTERYPEFKSKKIRLLGSFDSGVPEEYRHIPWYNF